MTHTTTLRSGARRTRLFAICSALAAAAFILAGCPDESKDDGAKPNTETPGGEQPGGGISDDEADFGPNAVIEPELVVTDLASWTSAVNKIKNSYDGDKNYIVRVVGDVTGLTTANLSSFSATKVSLRGTGSLSCISGALLKVGENLTVILRGPALKGKPDNNTALVTVWNRGEFRMESGSISGNINIASESEAIAGGVNVKGGSFIINGGTVSNNSGSSGTGGISVIGIGSSFIMTGGSISGNTGAGVWLAYTPTGEEQRPFTFRKTGGIIYGKDAEDGLKNTFEQEEGHAVYFSYATTWKGRTTTAGEQVNLFFENKEFSGEWERIAYKPRRQPEDSPVISGQQITLSSITSGAAIYYTTDGSTPTTSSTLYTSAAKPAITGTTTIKAIAVKEGMSNSDMLTATYDIAVLGGTGPGGGKIFYISQQGFTYYPDVSEYGSRTLHCLEAAPEDSGVYPWGEVDSRYSLQFYDAIGRGRQNSYTATWINPSAVYIVTRLNTGGKTDWYLPSKDELDMLFTNRNYVGNLEQGHEVWYWSSSTDSTTSAYAHQFPTSGGYSSGYKLMTSSRHVRAIRAF